jgi:cytochrome c peroxidase
LKTVISFLLCFLIILVTVQLFQTYGKSEGNTLTSIELLGKNLFFDTNLSTPSGQSCAACHDAEVGFSGGDVDINAHGAVYEGAVNNRFGNRHPPTAAYTGESPILYYNETRFLWIGGMFFDGRATGWTLGDPLAEQAKAPFLNPLEQNNPSSNDVVQKVIVSDYADLFEEVWGSKALDDAETAYEKIVRSIAAYERSDEVSPFSSKYDSYLAGETELTEFEALGLNLFQGKAGCEKCHMSEPEASGEPPLFTDFSYRNIGIPKNVENPFYEMPNQWNPDGKDFIDYGLGGFLKNMSYPSETYEFQLGAHKVPTLRNVDLRPNIEFIKSYGHNGFFKSLEEIVNFYNTRDVKDWPEPEVPVNVDTMLMGNLGLTSNEEAAVVAFLKTLNDGYIPDSQNSFYPIVLGIVFVGAVMGTIAFIAFKKYKMRSSLDAS